MFVPQQFHDLQDTQIFKIRQSCRLRRGPFSQSLNSRLKAANQFGIRRNNDCRAAVEMIDAHMKSTGRLIARKIADSRCGNLPCRSRLCGGHR